MSFLPIFHILSILITPFSIAMLITSLVDYSFNNENWLNFFSSALITFFIGMSVYFATQGKKNQSLDLKQAFLLTTIAWISIAIIGALPFYLSTLQLSLTDSFFESMSGITTTGSTILIDIESSPPGILVWRALLQWLGGIGIIVMALAVLPMLSIGGMQLFKTENFETPEKVIPKAASLAGGIFFVYTFLTIIWSILLFLSGMSGFDAILHSMTTIATGGYSTKTNSIGSFDNSTIDWIIVLGMIVGSLPFIHYLAATRGSLMSLIKDFQVRWFFGVLFTFIFIVFLLLLINSSYSWANAIRYSAFNVTSILTGTGYGTTDYGLWGGFAPTIFLLCMFIGGCAGSTTCGIRIFRFQVLISNASAQVNRLLRPHSIVLPHYNKKPLPESVTDSVMNFFFLYIFIFALIASILGSMGLDFKTAISASATSISNVGPGLGEIIGPSGNFSSLPDAAKWLICIGMIVGRLEIFTVLVILTPNFWKH